MFRAFVATVVGVTIVVRNMAIPSIDIGRKVIALAATPGIGFAKNF